MSNVFYRHLRQTYPVAVKGDGVHVIDREGRRYYDASGGVEDEGLLARVKTMGERLEESLTERFGNHRHVGDIRGRGLFRGLELVQDRATKAPFDPALALNARIKKAAMADGLMCYPMGGTIDGRQGDHILLAPPFIIDDSHVAEITAKLGRAVDQAIASVAA